MEYTGRLYTEKHMSTATMPAQTAHDSQKLFENLFREHYALVYRTACVITGNPEDAKDVLQTIFLRLLKRAAPPDFDKNPKGYFYRAAVNLSLDTVRSRRRELLTADMNTVEGYVHAERAAVHTIDNRLVETLATLSPRTVEILMLRYVHDYTEPEIANMLGRSRGTIAVTLFRARARLRKLLRTSAAGGTV